jgi:DNA-binding NarL/FixJ family response regulator
MPKRLLIIDDDETSRFLYRYYFRGISDIEIIAEFDNAEEALLQIPCLKPDTVIVDYSLPGMSGIDFAERVDQYSGIKVLLVTGHDNEYINSKLNNTPRIATVQKNWSEQAVEHIIAFCR